LDKENMCLTTIAGIDKTFTDRKLFAFLLIYGS
jgi:hypothetical protein